MAFTISPVVPTTSKTLGAGAQSISGSAMTSEEEENRRRLAASTVKSPTQTASAPSTQSTTSPSSVYPKADTSTVAAPATQWGSTFTQTSTSPSSTGTAPISGGLEGGMGTPRAAPGPQVAVPKLEQAPASSWYDAAGAKTGYEPATQQAAKPPYAPPPQLGETESALADKNAKPQPTGADVPIPASQPWEPATQGRNVDKFGNKLPPSGQTAQAAAPYQDSQWEALQRRHAKRYATGTGGAPSERGLNAWERRWRGQQTSTQGPVQAAAQRTASPAGMSPQEQEAWLAAKYGNQPKVQQQQGAYTPGYVAPTGAPGGDYTQQYGRAPQYTKATPEYGMKESALSAAPQGPDTANEAIQSGEAQTPPQTPPSNNNVVLDYGGGSSGVAGGSNSTNIAQGYATQREESRLGADAYTPERQDVVDPNTGMVVPGGSIDATAGSRGSATTYRTGVVPGTGGEVYEEAEALPDTGQWWNREVQGGPNDIYYGGGALDRGSSDQWGAYGGFESEGAVPRGGLSPREQYDLNAANRPDRNPAFVGARDQLAGGVKLPTTAERYAAMQRGVGTSNSSYNNMNLAGGQTGVAPPSTISNKPLAEFTKPADQSRFPRTQPYAHLANDLGLPPAQRAGMTSGEAQLIAPRQPSVAGTAAPRYAAQQLMPAQRGGAVRGAPALGTSEQALSAEGAVGGAVAGSALGPVGAVAGGVAGAVLGDQEGNAGEGGDVSQFETWRTSKDYLGETPEDDPYHEWGGAGWSFSQDEASEMWDSMKGKPYSQWTDEEKVLGRQMAENFRGREGFTRGDSTSDIDEGWMDRFFEDVERQQEREADKPPPAPAAQTPAPAGPDAGAAKAAESDRKRAEANAMWDQEIANAEKERMGVLTGLQGELANGGLEGRLRSAADVAAREQTARVASESGRSMRGMAERMSRAGMGGSGAFAGGMAELGKEGILGRMGVETEKARQYAGATMAGSQQRLNVLQQMLATMKSSPALERAMHEARANGDFERARQIQDQIHAQNLETQRIQGEINKTMEQMQQAWASGEGAKSRAHQTKTARTTRRQEIEDRPGFWDKLENLGWGVAGEAGKAGVKYAAGGKAGLK